MSYNLANLLYLITIVTFILALRFLSNPAQRAARQPDRRGGDGRSRSSSRGSRSASTSWWAIALAMLIGGGFGAVAARKVQMTAMPQMVALFNGVGGGAAALIALAELHRILPPPGAPKVDISLAIVFSALIGSISFSGSMVAFAKLQELIGGRPITYAGQQFVNGALFLGALACAIALVAGVQDEWLLWVLVGRVARLRRPLRAADRRRGHARRDLAAERVHGPRRRARRLRAREQRPDRGRDARRRLRHDADADDGAGDEPLDRERPLQCVRPGLRGGRSGGCGRRR